MGQKLVIRRMTRNDGRAKKRLVRRTVNGKIVSGKYRRANGG